MADLENLLKQATVIRDEKKLMANTANRVGSLLVDIVDALRKPGKYLSRLDNDTAEGLITFLKGIVSEGLAKLNGGATVGETIDSMIAGKGTLITPDGRLQTGRLEVRGSAMFHELIVNRLQALESDMVLSDSGHIESAELQEDGTWLLTLRKRWDFDWTAIAEHDVIYGEMNTLLEDGSHFTSWMRVLSVNASANTINVLLYEDTEVPGGKNFPPVDGMNILHRGNALNTERQSVWYMSSREGCIVYLEGVTKPIIEESNYYLIIGKLKRLDIFSNIPINYNHPYIYARGLLVNEIFNCGFNGNPDYELRMLGEWNKTRQYIKDRDAESGRYYQDGVIYSGCIWHCIVKAATIGRPPRYNNPEWIMAVGNPEFRVELTGAPTAIRPRNFKFTLRVKATLYNADVTADILDSDIEWTRYTEDSDGNQRVSSDNAWAIKHASAAKEITLTQDDLDILDGVVPPVARFIVSVRLRDGKEPVSAVFGYRV